MTRTDLSRSRPSDSRPLAPPATSENTPTTPAARVEVDDLHCRYGDFQAVRGIDLRVEPGEIVALLGTNGAGKTTTLSALLGERRADAGRVRVLGADPVRDRRTIAPRLGVVFQQAGLPDSLTPRESVRLWRRLQGVERQRIGDPDPVLDRVGLLPRRDTRVGALSGGERRRLELALALSIDPDLVVLDEPTTGMDPTSRRTTWELIDGLRARGCSVLLTTHYLEEAEALADRIAIMHHGRIDAAGSLAQLVASHPSTIEATVARTQDATDLLADAALDGETHTGPATPQGRTRLSVATRNLQADLHRLLAAADRHRLGLDDLRATPASLDAVFHAIATDTEDPR